MIESVHISGRNLIAFWQSDAVLIKIRNKRILRLDLDLSFRIAFIEKPVPTFLSDALSVEEFQGFFMYALVTGRDDGATI